VWESDKGINHIMCNSSTGSVRDKLRSLSGVCEEEEHWPQSHARHICRMSFVSANIINRTYQCASEAHHNGARVQKGKYRDKGAQYYTLQGENFEVQDV
jgi:hypothetical protein